MKQTTIFDELPLEERFIDRITRLARSKDFTNSRLGNKAAGRRLRRQLRALIKEANIIRMESLKLSKPGS